jgi:predicted ATPase
MSSTGPTRTGSEQARQHEAAYREHSFELVAVPPAPVAERAALIAGEIAARS